MNRLSVKVLHVESCDTLNIVKFSYLSETLSMMSLDLPNYVTEGLELVVTLNSSHVGIAKKFSGDISYSNQLPCIIKSIDNGELLSSIELTFFDSNICSIITVEMCKQMNLCVGDEVIALISASELSIESLT